MNFTMTLNIRNNININVSDSLLLIIVKSTGICSLVSNRNIIIKTLKKLRKMTQPEQIQFQMAKKFQNTQNNYNYANGIDCDSISSPITSLSFA